MESTFTHTRTPEAGTDDRSASVIFARFAEASYGSLGLASGGEGLMPQLGGRRTLGKWERKPTQSSMMQVTGESCHPMRSAGSSWL